MKKVEKILFILVFFILFIGKNSKVLADESIKININANTKEWTTSNVILMIDMSSTKLFDTDSNQAVQILLGEENSTNKWIDLGSGKNGVALKKSYTYIVKNNYKVSIRVVSWKKDDKTDLQQLAIQTFEVSNIDKTNPIIENISSNASSNSITVNINAKDENSGISKYTCVCETISKTQTGTNPKFNFEGLEPNREYSFTITVEDKLGNNVIQTKKFKTASDNQNTINSSSENTQIRNTVNQNGIIQNTDSTIANKIIPEIGDKNFLFVIIMVLIVAIILKK